MYLKIDLLEIAVFFVKILCLCQLLFGPNYVNASSFCEHTKNIISPEENYGLSSKLNYLGVLRVQLHNGEAPFMAFTGIVLIKANYALSNADIIGRIPINVFKEKAEAIFVQKNNKPWSCRATEYYTHPEYEIGVTNTLAVLSLDVEDMYNYLLKPICFPKEHFTSPKSIYAVGIMDYNKPDKVIYKMKYLNESNCKEYYGKTGLLEGFVSPKNYYCVYAPVNDTQCIWESGMALVSNVSGRFELVGLSIKGSGCAAPSRFVATEMYTHWIRSVTEPDSMRETNKAPEFLDSTRRVVTKKIGMLPEVTNETKAEVTNKQATIEISIVPKSGKATKDLPKVTKDSIKSHKVSKKNNLPSEVKIDMRDVPKMTEIASKRSKVIEATRRVPEETNMELKVTKATKTVLEVTEELSLAPKVTKTTTKMPKMIEKTSKVPEMPKTYKKKLEVKEEISAKVAKDTRKVLKDLDKTGKAPEATRGTVKVPKTIEATTMIPVTTKTVSEMNTEITSKAPEVTTAAQNTKTTTELPKVTEKSKVTETPEVTEVLEDDHDDIPIHLFLDDAAPRRVQIPEIETRHNLLHFRVSRNTSVDGTRNYVVVPSHKPKDVCENVELLHSEMYELNFDVETKGTNGVSTYKLAMNDLLQSDNRCVIVRVYTIPPAKVALEFNEFLDKTKKDVETTTESNTTNKSPLYFPIDNIHDEPPKNVKKREISTNSSDVPNYDLYITFYYTGFVEVEFKMYSKDGASERNDGAEESNGTEKNIKKIIHSDEKLNDINNENLIDSREHFEGLTKKPEMNERPFWGLKKPRNYL